MRDSQTLQASNKSRQDCRETMRRPQDKKDDNQARKQFDAKDKTDKTNIMKTKAFFLAAALCAGCIHAHANGPITMGDLTKAQQDSIIFAFPQCTQGTIYLKDGSIISTKFNYNYYEPQVLFWNDKPEFPGDTLRRLDNLAEVILLEIGDRSFVPVLSGIGEVILNNKVSLVQTKKVNISEKKTGAYGTGGSTASIRNVSSINNNATSGGNYTGQTTFATVKYEFSSNSELTVDYTLFLMKDGKTYPLTKKNLSKLFPKAAGFVKQYLEDHKPDLDNPEEMLDLVNLANANEQSAK